MSSSPSFFDLLLCGFLQTIAFAFVAVMTQILAPESKEVKALLTLHVLMKVSSFEFNFSNLYSLFVIDNHSLSFQFQTVIFPVAYIGDLDIVRSTSHIIAIGALCGAFLKLIY